MSKKSQKLVIEETDNVMDDHLLDLLGNEFKFDHVKGMAEWLKNSVDAYIGKGVDSSHQVVIFRFTDTTRKPRIECIDFVGMDSEQIEKAFKRWGDPNASKRGKKIETYGGHGNGGKFYMRQMFKESRFITYKDGRLNVFGFSSEKKYGYAVGYKDKKMSPNEAIVFAEINDLQIPTEVKAAILKQETGFTILQGDEPEGFKRKINPQREAERLKNYPQSYRILLSSQVSVVYNGASLYGLLKPDLIEPMAGFEQVKEVPVPESLPGLRAGHSEEVILANEQYPCGKLVLRTSSEPMPRGSKRGELNRIDVLGKIGVIGSYQVHELGVRVWPQVSFIYGECSVPILEDFGSDCVSNDRTKLVKNTKTDALLKWISDQVDELASEVAAVEREKQLKNQKDITSKFNDVLNEWKNKHMKKIMSDIFSIGDVASGGIIGGGKIGSEVVPPKDGFNFKWPEVNVPVNTPSKITLKICVPDALPIGAVINVTSSNDSISTEEDQYVIKSDNLKTTKDGKEVAFIDMSVSGEVLGEEAIITAGAGKFCDSVKVVVVEKNEVDQKGKSFPRVLLSDHDADPLELVTGKGVHLSERDPVIFQRPQDLKEGIYWINTSSPLASIIYDRFGSNSIQWRNFLFERYVNIFVKEAIHELERKEYETFSADTVDEKISEVVLKTHKSAKTDLESLLFEEVYIDKDSKD